MIPSKLSLRNFMCYRENVPPLSFEGIHIACLCGDNGNGKSALLDAVTWALWGKSRAKSDDDLVHLGQNDMEVELEFLSGGQKYRVIRKHTKSSLSRPGQTVLELQVASDGTFRSLTGNTLRETEQRIVDILLMDYQTFINSAFLLQGRADEFSIKQPGQRKEILADILSLSLYDRLEEQAKNLAKDRGSEAERLKITIAEIESQLGFKGEYEAELDKTEKDVTQLEEQVRVQESSINALRQEKESLELKRSQLVDIESRLEEAGKELDYWGERIREHRSKVTECERIIADRASIEEGYAQLVEIEALSNELNSKLSQLLDLRERITKLEKAVEEAGKALVVEHGIIQSRIAEREARFQKLPSLEEKLTQARQQLAELTKLEAAASQRREYAQQLVSRIQLLESTNVQLEGEIAALKGKLELLGQADAHCPLCESELGVEGRQRIEVKFREELEIKDKTYHGNKAEIEKIRLEHWAVENELAQRESSISKERTTRQRQVSVIEKELIEAKQASEELVQERVKLREVEEHLAKKDYAVSEQQALLHLERAQRELGYDKERHERLRAQLAEFRGYENLNRRLEEATRVISEEKTALDRAEEALSNLQSRIKEDEARRENLRLEVAALPAVVDKLVKAEETHRILLSQERQVRDRIAVLQEKLRSCAELEKSKEEKGKLLRRTLEEEKIYKELSEAFGKRGIQALLIERALPEIEVEANRLLGKMTDNRMSLRLETQRETRKGSTIETLDIKIADELGTRNYELYSGGEAFRINLALRIALSKLLVKRAGASLPTLIIDEGFGTQDSSGREKLIEAINSIQDDFERIIVITHLEELKDAFPVRINITKTAEGSMISVN